MRRLAIAILLAACTPKAAPAPDAAPAPVAFSVPQVVVDAAPPPTLEGPWQVDLGELGVVAIPVGAHSPRPMMIALHGGSDRPEWACQAWSGIANSYAFVVCPRGVGAVTALAWSSPEDTKMRIQRSVAAVEARYPDWIKPTSTFVLVGFSMGATQVAYRAQAEPKKYPRVVLAESAYAPDPAMAFAKPWAIGGGERAIFLCTTPGCEGTYRQAAKNVARFRIPARLNIAGTSAHGMWDQVIRSMRRDWPWLVEGAEGWEGYVGPTDEPPGRTEIYEPSTL